jgi:Holliday junction resolvasome RuvABC endonuclease subunit
MTCPTHPEISYTRRMSKSAKVGVGRASKPEMDACMEKQLENYRRLRIETPGQLTLADLQARLLAE